MFSNEEYKTILLGLQQQKGNLMKAKATKANNFLKITNSEIKKISALIEKIAKKLPVPESAFPAKGYKQIQEFIHIQGGQLSCVETGDNHAGDLVRTFKDKKPYIYFFQNGEVLDMRTHLIAKAEYKATLWQASQTGLKLS